MSEANRETGGRTIYAPTFSGGPRALAEQARIAREHGVRMALVAPMLVGPPAFVELRVDLDIPVLAHPAFAGAGAHRAAAAARQALPAVRRRRDDLPQPRRALQLPPRHLPRDRRRRARARGTGCAPILPGARRRHDVERVPEMLAGYGNDTMLLIGGALLTAGDQPRRARPRVRAAVSRRA